MAFFLYTVEQLRNFEQQVAATLPQGTLMQRAGDVAAAWIARRYPQARRILVICGPGNNGGDGYVCARSLRLIGRDVACVAMSTPATDDARAAILRWQQDGAVTLNNIPARFDDWDIVVDAMFGLGLARPLAGAYFAAAEALRACRSRIVAIDLPSGLDADSGAWVGGVSGVHADCTVSFLGAKPGLFTAAGVDACGCIVIDSLGLTLPAGAGRLLEPADFAALASPRRRNTHKGTFGNVLVIGGAAGMMGAPLLAARAALRLGAGRVYVDVIGGGVGLDPVMPELMFREASNLDGVNATVIGCGLGSEPIARARLVAALQGTGACVIDADALNLLADDSALAALARGGAPQRVLTPHPLEAARLLQSDVATVQADRIGAARALAKGFGHWVVLKGAGSVVAHDDDVWINPTGSAALATAGSGDVLAGFIGALLAQGYDSQTAILGAVWLHGRAADDFAQDVGLVASDLAPLAARALARLRASSA
jgi:ADP-dependent NAD(P)H-hydrate dehydratase / NAD(P)H-hydrate epimerase